MNIAIIHAGYVGIELAALWTKKGHHVTVTTRHPERLPLLARVAQKCVILKEINEEELSPLLVNNDVIVVTTAADTREEYESTYFYTANMIRQIALKKTMIRRLIYTSSVAVYGDYNGLWVDESSELKAKSDQGRILIDTEKAFLSLKELGWHVCILRFAEIYGPGRELSARFHTLGGEKPAGQGSIYTNMLHRDDAAAAVEHALRHHFEGVYNLADDDHPTRQQMFDAIAEKLKAPKIKWDAEAASWQFGNKRVSNHKIKASGFSFLHPHRLLD